ncbi:MAG: recombination-associated protein RdgC [Mariprofundaceae bacterium]|nr:recombination-associated protein RdgC [Mariprofundaceae bacterium]
MWFNNIHFYRFESPFTMDEQTLGEKLGEHAARACGQIEQSCEGWAKPLGRDGHTLVHQTDGQLMICLQRQDRLLPSSVVREQLDEQVWALEHEKGRALNRHEKADLKDELVQTLLPQAFVRTSHVYACILPQDGWLIINASSVKRAEDFLAALIKTIPTLSLVAPQPEESLSDVMRHWMLDETRMPEGFTLEDACKLTSQGEHGGSIQCRQEDLAKDEILAHVRGGKAVTELALNWQSRISFVLSEDLSLKKLRFDSAVLDEAGDADDASTRFDADFTIMAGELRQLIAALMAALPCKKEA